MFLFRHTFFFFFSSSGGWGKIKLKLTTLPRIFIRVVCRFNSVTYRFLKIPINSYVVACRMTASNGFMGGGGYMYILFRDIVS